MMRRRRQQGFTLVELLIALALAGVVALLMLEGIRFATLGLQRTSDRADQLETRRGIEDLLRRMLSTAFAAPLRGDAPALTGGPHAMQFLTLAEDGGAGLYRIDLGLAGAGGDRRLLLTRRRLDAPGARDAERIVLAPRLGDLRIAYFGSATPNDSPHWQESWEGLRYPPTLVRVALDLGDGPAHPPLVVRLWAAPR